ncbi:MAG: hypothetical protein ABSF53_22510 [Terracidiphilus sp.]|jgi:hypothetical protein
MTDLVSLIDAEITNLKRARAIIAGIKPSSPVTKSLAVKTAKVKRTMSPEARARIAVAQKKRWAAVQKAAK